MSVLSDKAKQELFNALKDRKSGAFVIDGKLVSFEVENDQKESGGTVTDDDLSREIEGYPKLKESLSNYYNDPNMKRYSASDLKAKRHDKRK